jgi:hypothetical protein
VGVDDDATTVHFRDMQGPLAPVCAEILPPCCMMTT